MTVGWSGRNTVSRRAAAAGGAALLLGGRARAQGGAPLRIGVIGDFTGPYAAIGGEGNVVAARLAVADFGGTVLGRPVEVVSADHANKVDTALAIVRRWFGEGVTMVTDVTNSAVAFGIQGLLPDAHRIAIYTTTGNTELIGRYCTPLSALWSLDGWAYTVAPVRALLKQGKTSFFLIVTDYAFGKTMEADGTEAINAGGGRILGVARHPLNTADFSSYLLQAKSSGAEVVMLMNGGADLTNSYKQAYEFDLPKAQTLVAPLVFLTDIDSLGLEVAQGLQFVQSWYWDRSDATRAWARRYAAERNRMPGDVDASTYSAVLQYLRAVAAAGTDAGEPVMAELKKARISDMFTPDAYVRADGRLMFDRLNVRVKKPSQSRGRWDYLEVIGTVPAEEGARPLAHSACGFIKS